MNKLPISVFIITKNEASNIARVLITCQSFDEIIVVDSGSTDDTVSIAQSQGARVILQDWLGYAKQKQFAMQQCRNEWVLNLDADEELTDELIAAFAQTVKDDDCDYTQIYRNDYFIDGFFSDSTYKPNNKRLFKKSHATYRINDLVHEGPDFVGKKKKISLAFNHYGYAKVENLANKYNYYSSLKATEKYAKSKRPSRYKLFFIFPIIFIKTYFIQRYFLSGGRGFIFSVLNSFYAFLKEAKLYELEKNDQESVGNQQHKNKSNKS